MRGSAVIKAAAAVLALGLTVPAAGARERAPELVCSEAGGFGFAVAGQRGLSCIYYRADDIVEFYVGSSGRLGMDLGTSNARRLVFSVGGVDTERVGELAGRFVGAQAGATIGFGLSEEALTGGATGRATLVPTTNQGGTGINISAGLGTFDLRFAGSERRTLRERY